MPSDPEIYMAIDLDQAFTSSGYAMLYALENWDEFTAAIAAKIGHPIPICRTQFAAHAARISLMIEPSRTEE